MQPAPLPPERMPISWHVARWGDEPFSRGSWSYVRPAGSPADRWTLAEPIDDRLWLCGEAIGTDQPAMTHGAFDSGRRAAQRCATIARDGERVVVIGAGFAGLGAARALIDRGIEHVVVEARDRIGGRAHTIDLPGISDEFAVQVDAGAAWLQQFPKNEFGDLSRDLGVTLIPTDFHDPLSAARGGAAGDVRAAFAALEQAAAVATRERDRSIADVVRSIASSAALDRALEADVILETGGPPGETSARWFFREEGVGNDDHWLRGGYGILLEHLARGVDLRLGRAVTSIRWSATGVMLTFADSTTEQYDRCLCSVPISLLQRDEPHLDPGLPPSHRLALSRLGIGVVEKVLLRFREHWWPKPASGYFRWYDSPASWCEWVDLSDGCGAPVVAGLIAGEAVARQHHGRTDEAVALAAAHALNDWADAVGGRDRCQ